MTDPRQRAAIASPVSAAVRPMLRVEVAIVLLVTFGWSGLSSVVSLATDALERSLRETAVALNPSTVNPDDFGGHVPAVLQLLDFAAQSLRAVHLFAWAALGLYLLRRTHIRPRDIGFTPVPRAREGFSGLALAALIGIPGLGLYVLGRELGLTVTVVAGDPNAVWWQYLTFVLIAIANAVAEEVVVVGYLATRLAQLGIRPWLIIAASALLRGSYHLYQGVGAGIGNVVMGVIFGLVWWRWRSLWALIVAHAVIDIVAFVGYSLLAGHVTWL